MVLSCHTTQATPHTDQAPYPTVVATDSAVVDTVQKKVYKPDPQRALWMGAIVPGYGQIVNKKYWKLPIVYGGFMGFAYAITWNNNRYQSYRTAYRDIIDNDPNTNSHIDILPKGYTLANYPGGINTYTSRLNTAQNQFRQYRDLSIILSVAYYALVLLDAYVDAELYDFDISPNLVMNVAPLTPSLPRATAYEPHSALGVQCSIRF